MDTIDIGIVGLGSRGLSIVERCITHVQLPEYRDYAIHLHVVEPRVPGVGIHAQGQPDYLLLNTICCQLSMFPDKRTIPSPSSRSGPTLFEWARDQGYKLEQDGYTLSKTTGREIQPTDYLPRRVLGEYLAWFYRYLAQNLPGNLKLSRYSQRAIDLEKQDQQEVIALEDAMRIKVDYVFLTLGHTENGVPPPKDARVNRLISQPYPIPERFEEVKPQQTIAVTGFGLSAMDVITALTVGRGGRFAPGDEEQKRYYLPSGREPHIVLCSRTGLPYRARPYNNRTRKYSPVVFTREAIRKLRERHEHSMLDFRQEVLPLILAEMQLAYYRQAVLLSEGVAAEAQLLKRCAEEHRAGSLSALLEQLAEQHGFFHPDRATNPSLIGALTDTESYQSRVLEFVRDDLRHAGRGLQGSPLKAALEVFRDLRDVIREAVDFGGLTPESHEEFMQHYAPLMNRAVIGPQKERHEELLALAQADILSIPCGPAPRIEWDGKRERWSLISTRLARPATVNADWLCLGYSEQPSVDNSASVLVQNLSAQGRLKPYRPQRQYGYGVDLDTGLHPLNSRGEPQSNIWVLGPLCEGITFYNHYVPSPGSPSRALTDAHLCVERLFERLKVNRPAQKLPPVQAPSSALQRITFHGKASEEVITCEQDNRSLGCSQNYVNGF